MKAIAVRLDRAIRRWQRVVLREFRQQGCFQTTEAYLALLDRLVLGKCEPPTQQERSALGFAQKLGRIQQRGGRS